MAVKGEEEVQEEEEEEMTDPLDSTKAWEKQDGQMACPAGFGLFTPSFTEGADSEDDGEDEGRLTETQAVMMLSLLPDGRQST